MRNRLHFDADDLALAIVLWVCSLPLLALVAVPAFGWKIAGLTAIVLLALFLVLCWARFGSRFSAASGQGNKNRFKSGQTKLRPHMRMKVP